MIDLHSHLLPQIDDGAKSVADSIEMARIAVADGITIMACTPHILPGVYDNTGADIAAAAARLQTELDECGVALDLVCGADAHVAPDLLEGLGARRVPSLAGSRYFLLEPPHHLAPPRFEEHLFDFIRAGYVPVITHPERLSWIESNPAIFARAVERGAWLQVTAGALTGRFGRRPRYWAERLISEGLVHLLATDAHDSLRRPPLLAEGLQAAAERLGADEATHLVETRPAGILRDANPDELPALLRPAAPIATAPTFWQRARQRASF